MEDTIDNTSVFLRFNEYENLGNDKNPEKINFIFQTDMEQREYLTDVFHNDWC